jgi:hypothetical protein
MCANYDPPTAEIDFEAFSQFPKRMRRLSAYDGLASETAHSPVDKREPLWAKPSGEDPKKPSRSALARHPPQSTAGAMGLS